jgi:hypothetical protein
MPTTQDSYMHQGVTDDNPIIDDNDECLLGTDSRVDHDSSDVQFSTQQQVAQTTSISFAMLKRVACELVEVTMKLNDESKRVAVCGMMLRATNLLRGNGVLGQSGFEQAVEQYLH